MVHNLHHERSSKQDSRLLDAVMFVAADMVSQQYDFSTWHLISDEPADSPERAHATGLQQQRGPVLESFTYPSHRECAQYMAVRHEQDV